MALPADPPESGAQAEPGRREAILGAALELFASHGFRGTTIKAIADRAGVRSPALLYWYFPSKEDLLDACIAEYGPVLVDAEAERARYDEPPEVFLPRLLAATLGRMGERRTILALRIITLETRLVAAKGFSLAAARPVNLFTVLEGYLDHQVARSVLRPHDTAVVARLLVAQMAFDVQGRGAAAVLSPSLNDDARLVRGTVDVLLGGLRVD